MLSVLVLPAALLTAGAAYWLALVSLRLAAGVPVALAALVGAPAVLGSAAAVGWLARPSYLAPFAALLWAVGGLAGAGHGLLRRPSGRHT
ncbi:hypothetical protein ACFWOG_12020 [Kitasatospora sp. NPDC058406]|uniref:hypothetical protein n=1 Tax=Kitasatospora sp. NPDC058406 TaxID=3346483 RepID=UPI00366620D6